MAAEIEMTNVRVAGISGSARRDSYNRTLLLAAAAELPPGVEFHEWRRLAAVPVFDEDLDAPSRAPAVVSLRRALARADAVLLATPEYNHSIPGGLKNVLDWASRPPHDNPLRGKRVAVVGASTGVFGAVRAQADLRRVLTAIGADVLDGALAVPQAATAFTPEGRLRDPELAQELRSIVKALVWRSATSVAA